MEQLTIIVDIATQTSVVVQEKTITIVDVAIHTDDLEEEKLVVINIHISELTYRTTTIIRCSRSTRS